MTLTKCKNYFNNSDNSETSREYENLPIMYFFKKRATSRIFFNMQRVLQ